jgi:septum formation protein
MNPAYTAENLSLILASSSPFRRELLSRLGVEFSSASPEIDESPRSDENPETLVRRLALDKALAVGKSHPDALIIGSDQVAVLEHRILGKPGSHERAVEQLRQASGKSVTFYTGLCLYNSASGERQIGCEPFKVRFRHLTHQEIEHYLRKETPYNCAGSFKSEGLGVCLFQGMRGNDPTALIGLPLIQLVSMLRNEGMDVLAA